LLRGIFLIFFHRPRAHPCSTPAASTARPVLACMQQAHSVRSPLSDPCDRDLRRTAFAAQPAVTRLVGSGRRTVRWNDKFLRLLNSYLIADWRIETIGRSRCGVCKVNQSITVSGEGLFLPPDCSLSALSIVPRSVCPTSPRPQDFGTSPCEIKIMAALDQEIRPRIPNLKALLPKVPSNAFHRRRI
jgi:hypothetical protein